LRLDLCFYGILRSTEWYFRIDVSGQHIGPILKGQTFEEKAWTSGHLKRGPKFCFETSLRKSHSVLRNTTEECRSQFHRGGSTESSIKIILLMELHFHALSH